MTISQRKRQNIITNLIQSAKAWLSTSVVLQLERDSFWPDTDIYEERVLFMFHLNDSKFRLAIISFIESPLFQVGITIVILASSLCIALDDPVESLYAPSAQRSSTTLVLKLLEVVWTVIFTVEMILQILAKGLFLGTKTYLADTWGMFDCAIVGTSWASIFQGGAGLTALRCLRVIKSLRVLKRSVPDIHIMLEVIARVSLQILVSLAVVLLVALMFSIILVQLSAGKNYRCVHTATGLPHPLSIACNPPNQAVNGFSGFYSCPDDPLCPDCWACVQVPTGTQ